MRSSIAIIVGLLLFWCEACAPSKEIQRYSQVDVDSYDTLHLDINTDTLRALGENYLVKGPFGNWEMYLSGEPAYAGAAMGCLSRDLYNRQETIFIDKLLEDVPSIRKRKWIMRFVRWYNRDLDRHIPDSYLSELGALSNYLSGDYDYLGTPYQRTLWMHAAHDIGHVLQDLAVVGCSSFAAWDSGTADGKLLIGRNLDFYMNDAFAEQKMVYFVKPSEGIPYMSVSWPGMVGVLSGMNLEGLSVTLNAGKSSIPFSAKTPISLVARSILQHASNIDEAVRIARQHKVFVSESLMIGSAKDGKAVLIEISPKHIDVVEASGDRLICTNHFQGQAFSKDRRNEKHIKRSHSLYRYRRLEELLNTRGRLLPVDAIQILRDRSGHGGMSIGLGNDKSLNHLLAHHGIVFLPEDRRVYVSNGPGQMGPFVCYDLREVFRAEREGYRSFSIDSLALPADDFILSDAYSGFKEFRILTDRYLDKLAAKDVDDITDVEIGRYVGLNPDLWLGHDIAGRIFYLKQNYTEAQTFFRQALDREIPTQPAKRSVQNHLKRATTKWNKRR